VSVAFRHVLERFRKPGVAIVADLAAGTRQPMFGWASFAKMVIVVADPSAKSLIAARRLVRAGVATHILANRVESDTDTAHIQAQIGLPLVGSVPYDVAVVDAEKRGSAPIDMVPDAPAVKAVGELAARFLEQTR
jgi:CO dehydrogenase maturation factor